MTGKGQAKGITYWPETERPRERLLAKGPDALSDAQLLAILLRTGRRDSSAVQVAIELLSRVGGIAGLATCGVEELCAVQGVGPAKAAQLKAAAELGRRSLATPLSVWVGQAETPLNDQGINRLSSYSGVMGQAMMESPEEAPNAADKLTGEMFGRRVAEAVVRWKRGAA